MNFEMSNHDFKLFKIIPKVKKKAIWGHSEILQVSKKETFLCISSSYGIVHRCLRISESSLWSEVIDENLGKLSVDHMDTIGYKNIGNTMRTSSSIGQLSILFGLVF